MLRGALSGLWRRPAAPNLARLRLLQIPACRLSTQCGLQLAPAAALCRASWLLHGALSCRAVTTGAAGAPRAAPATAKAGNLPKGPPKKRKRMRNAERLPSFRAAIVGRPNVGKSTLFNRLVGKKMAIVHDTPGVTRDRREAVGSVGDLAFTVFDTAGLEREIGGDELRSAMFGQTEAAVCAADVVLFVIDAREGITGDDQHFARWLRKKGLPVVLVANKCEGDAGDAGVSEAFELGFGPPVEISAEHGEGLAGLFQAMLPHAERAAEAAARREAEMEARRAEDEARKAEQAAAEEAARPAAAAEGGLVAEEEEGSGAGEAAETAAAPAAEAGALEGPLELAIVGKPNVGKSTILNQLLGENRVVVSAVPGTTRDAITVEWTSEGRRIRLVDTAGLRRQSTVTDKLEGMAWGDTQRAINFAHVTALVVDAREPLGQADLTLAERCTDEGRPVVIVANKMDLVPDKQRKAAVEAIRGRAEMSLRQVRGVQVVPLCAKTGEGLPRLMPAVHRLYERWNRRVPTSQLNRWLARATAQKAPPIPSNAGQGVRIKIRYMTQVKARPPTFALFFSKAPEIPEAYVRYLENSLRDEFDLQGVPLRLHQRRIQSIYKRK
eukprot:tig00021038_g17583.t1